MNTRTVDRKIRPLAAALTIGLCAILTSSSVAGAEDQGRKDSPGFIEKMSQWQDRMSEKFRDTWQNLRKDMDAKSQGERTIATASVDLREQKDSYMVRLNLPNRDLDKVEIKLSGDTLNIVAPAEEKAGRYEQVVALSGVAPNAEPKIERKQADNMIVITVPKRTDGLALAEPAPPASRGGDDLLPLTSWERDVFDQMQRMRFEMNSAFENAFREFKDMPEYKGIFDEPRFGSTVDLKEESDRFVVSAYLPDRDMQNVNVTVEDRTLRIHASAQTESKEGDTQSARKSAYSQVLTLPAPVQADKMKVDKKEGMVVITLPKSKPDSSATQG